MEEIRQASYTHYNNMSSQEKENVLQMFNSYDVDKNGWVSFPEVVNQFVNSMPHDKIQFFFYMIDTDRNGLLDFWEFVTLYYVINSRPLCNCCRRIVTGLYFCCVRCWEMHVNSGVAGVQPYELCAECYYQRSFTHEHQEFLDNFVLLRSRAQENRREEKAMEAGRLYFRSLAGPELHVALKLFQAMDQNGDGLVHSSEVIHFLARKGVPATEAPRVFENMGMMQNSYLTLEDVVAVWYVVVMRPVCNCCKVMIMGSYYICVACFHSSNNDGDAPTYDLCPGCYSTGNYYHQHQHRIFVDNYALLHLKKGRRVSSSTGALGKLNERWPLRKALRFIVEAAAEATLTAAIGAAMPAGACSIM